MCWSFGQYFQCKLFTKISVSIAIPISTNLQTILISMIGMIIFCVFLTSYKAEKNEDDNHNFLSGDVITYFDCGVYRLFSVPKPFDEEGESAFFSQNQECWSWHCSFQGSI
ncbi:GRP family sugar transporter [Moellerella wisconsensis]|uniref:GRP family sugar transporter n=1 Tax=Moellerella wisconsensis TaxID=158849 RepID=UPI0009081956